MNIIYPLVQTVVKGIQINVILDEFAGLSYATEKTVSNLKLAIRDLPEKVEVEGFGGLLSDPIDKFVEITFKNGATIACNIVTEICDALPPVTNSIFRIWPEFQKYKNELSYAIEHSKNKTVQDKIADRVKRHRLREDIQCLYGQSKYSIYPKETSSYRTKTC